MRFELTILGSSAAMPTPERFCSAQLLRTESASILIDCGEGTQMQLLRMGQSLAGLDTILISHLHGDHYFGLPGLLTSQALLNRQRPLTIISPPGLRERLHPLLEWDKYEWPFELVFLELPSDRLDTDNPPEQLAVFHRVKDLEILPFPLQHRLPTAGYLIQERKRLPNLRPEQIKRYAIPVQQLKDIKEGLDFRRSDGTIIPNAELVHPAPEPRSFAYCSDTRYLPQIVAYIRKVDLLYHEATFQEFLHDKAISTQHSTAQEAAKIAQAAEVGQLIIGHFSTRYPNTDALLMEARAIFPNTKAARELERHTVPLQKRNS
ncbi:MAG: ribonuclease Z [Bacteroidota bacterium]